MLTVQDIPLNTTFTVNINGALPRLSADLENEIESLWLIEQQRRKKAIFNGRIMSASTVFNNEIHGSIVEYRYLIAQRAKPALFNDLQVRPVAVSGLLTCADGIVFGQRANTMTQDPGLWELVPSGGVDTSHINDTANQTCPKKIDFISQILTELREEIGIKSDFISNIKPFCLVDDSDSHVLDIGIAIESSLSYNEILTMHQNAPTQEYERLTLVTQSDINPFIRNEAARLVEVSTALLRNYYGN